jgi:type I restriction enzyme S subunit
MSRNGSVPEGWQRAPLRDVVDVNPRRAVAAGAAAPYVEMAAVREDTRGITSFAIRTANGSGSRFQNGDTIFARITPCAENGKIAFVDCLPPGECATGSTEFIVLSPKADVLDPKFLFYWASSPWVRGLAVSRMTGTSGRQRVPDSVFREELTILLPPLPEQRGIAAVLTSMDEAIERTEHVIARAAELKQALAHELLTRGLPGRHTRYKQTVVGEIPECWGVAPLGQVARIQSGVAKNEKARRTDPIVLPYLRVANVQAGYLDLTEVKTIEIERDEFPRFQLLAGDVLFTEGGDADKLGRGAIWPGHISPCVHQNHVFAVRPDKARLTPEFLAVYAASAQSRRYFLLAAKQTTNLASVNASQLGRLPIVLPSPEEQNSIIAVIAAADSRIEGERAQLLRLQETKERIARALLTGEVRVTKKEELDGKI